VLRVLRDMPLIESLSIVNSSTMSISGQDPEKFVEFSDALMGMTQLKELNLDSVGDSGIQQVADKIQQLKSLTSFGIGGELSGRSTASKKLIQELSKLKNLREIRLSGRFYDEDMMELINLFSELPDLERIDLSGYWSQNVIEPLGKALFQRSNQHGFSKISTLILGGFIDRSQVERLSKSIPPSVRHLKIQEKQIR
jgi:hypothetical protein